MAVKAKPKLVAWVFVAAGAAGVVAGIAMFSVPLALIVGGCISGALGLFGVDVDVRARRR